MQPRKVYFYGTCLVDLFFPDAGMAGMQLLRADGGCLLNVGGALEAKHSRLPVQHIAEFLWERTRAR